MSPSPEVLAVFAAVFTVFSMRKAFQRTSRQFFGAKVLYRKGGSGGDSPASSSGGEFFSGAHPSHFHLIMDFDNTMTCSKSSQCHDLLHNRDLMPAEFCKEMARMLDFSTPNPVLEGKPTSYWWDHVHALLVTHQVTHSQLMRCLEEAERPMMLREGLAPLLRHLHSLRVPVTVVSAGIEEIIERHLRIEGVMTDNIVIHANRFDFEKGNEPDRKCIGLSKSVHTKNKNESYHHLRDWFDHHSLRLSQVGVGDSSDSGDRSHLGGSVPKHTSRRLLVIGDSVGDAAAGDGVPAAQRLCVGFYDPSNHWAPRERFEECYDVLVPSDETFEWLRRAFGDTPSCT